MLLLLAALSPSVILSVWLSAFGCIGLRYFSYFGTALSAAVLLASARICLEHHGLYGQGLGFRVEP